MAAPAVTRTMQLTYGTFVVGGTTRYQITGSTQLREEFGVGSFSFNLLVQEDDEGEFQTRCNEIEDEFTKRRQRVLLEIDGNTHKDWNPATNTGFNSAAHVAKQGTPGADSGLSRLYSITITVEIPAADNDARQDSQITVEYDEARRRTITIEGVYTANVSPLRSATEQYAAVITAYATSVLTGVDAVAKFELIGERTKRDDQDKGLDFMRRFHEVIANQSQANLDEANVVEHTLQITQNIPQPGDSGGGGVKRLELFTVSWNCWVDKENTTDLKTLWTGTIRDHIKEEFISRYAPTQFAITDENVALIPSANQISATMQIMAAIDPTDVIESIVTSRIVENSGHVFTGAWSGGLFDKYADQGHGARRRFGIRAVRVLGSLKPKQRIGKGGGTLFGVEFKGGAAIEADGDGVRVEADPALGDFGIGGGGAPQSGWIMTDNDSAATVKHLGQPNGDQIMVTDLVEQTIEEWVEAPGGSGQQADFGVSFTGASN